MDLHQLLRFYYINYTSMLATTVTIIACDLRKEYLYNYNKYYGEEFSSYVWCPLQGSNLHLISYELTALPIKLRERLVEGKGFEPLHRLLDLTL